MVKQVQAHMKVAQLHGPLSLSLLRLPPGEVCQRACAGPYAEPKLTNAARRREYYISKSTLAPPCPHEQEPDTPDVRWRARKRLSVRREDWELPGWVRYSNEVHMGAADSVGRPWLLQLWA